MTKYPMRAGERRRWWEIIWGYWLLPIHAPIVSDEVIMIYLNIISAEIFKYSACVWSLLSTLVNGQLLLWNYRYFLSLHCIFGAQYKLNITWLTCSPNFQYLLYNIFTVNWRLISLYCCYFVANNLRLRNARILWAILASKPYTIFPKSKH